MLQKRLQIDKRDVSAWAKLLRLEYLDAKRGGIAALKKLSPRYSAAFASIGAGEGRKSSEFAELQVDEARLTMYVHDHTRNVDIGSSGHHLPQIGGPPPLWSRSLTVCMRAFWALRGGLLHFKYVRTYVQASGRVQGPHTIQDSQGFAPPEAQLGVLAPLRHL